MQWPGLKHGDESALRVDAKPHPSCPVPQHFLHRRGAMASALCLMVKSILVMLFCHLYHNTCEDGLLRLSDIFMLFDDERTFVCFDLRGEY